MANKPFFPLPNGAWIMLDDIRLIEPCAKTTPRVVVWCGNNPVILEFESYVAATEYASKLASTLNDIRAL